MSRSHEAFWWSLFSGGGVMAALFMPALILVSGFLLPTNDLAEGVDRYQRITQVVGFWPVRLVLFIVIALSCFHCAHRIRHTLMDLGLRGAQSLLMLLCYGAATAGTVTAAVLLVGF